MTWTCWIDRPLSMICLWEKQVTWHLRSNGQEYNRYYLLADGIYPPWSCFLQSIRQPDDEKRKHFASRQEACRKDVERCFRVLQARFSIIHNLCRQWSMDTIADIVFACCILHNMILEDERDVCGLENVLGVAVVYNVALYRGMTLDQFTSWLLATFGCLHSLSPSCVGCWPPCRMPQVRASWGGALDAAHPSAHFGWSFSKCQQCSKAKSALFALLCQYNSRDLRKVSAALVPDLFSLSICP